jgi:hypothetical protein
MEPNQNQRPLTAVSEKKRQRRMSRTSEQHWDRLQRDFLRAVSAEYPNPGRKDCPGREALLDLALRMQRREDLQGDLVWKHAIQCGPCYEEYIGLRDVCTAGSKSAVREQHVQVPREEVG